MTVRTLVLESATKTSEYWVMALVDLPKDSTCDPGNYTEVADGANTSLLFSWTIGTSMLTQTFITDLVPSTNGQYAAIYIAQQDASHKGMLQYTTPVQK